LEFEERTSISVATACVFSQNNRTMKCYLGASLLNLKLNSDSIEPYFHELELSPENLKAENEFRE
jgi:hypothetical protein